jgi:hypothetical protein
MGLSSADGGFSPAIDEATGLPPKRERRNSKGIHHAALRSVSASDSMLAAFGFTSQNLPT